MILYLSFVHLSLFINHVTMLNRLSGTTRDFVANIITFLVRTKSLQKFVFIR